MTPPAAMKQCDGKLAKRIGYYAGWSETRDCMKTSPSDIDPTLYIHIHYAFGIVDADLRISFPSSEDMNRFVRLVTLKQKNKDLKIILSLGGWCFQNPGPTVDRFKNIMATKASRATFISSAPSGYWYLRNLKIAEIASSLDYIVYMTYDINGNWDYSIPSIGGFLNGHRT